MVTREKIASESAEKDASRHVVHLPVYEENAYQPNIMEAQEALGWRVTHGGAGGNFLRTALRVWKPDILHLHWLHPYLLRPSRAGSWARGLRFLAEIFLIRRQGTRIVWTVHNLTNHESLHSDIELALTRRFVRQCDLILTHGEYASSAAKERFRIPEHTPVLSTRFPNYCERYKCDTSRQQARSHWGYSDEHTIIGFLGRVQPYKQVVELVEAFRNVAGEHDRLLIGGRASSEDYAGKVNAAIQDDTRVRFLNEYIADQEMGLFLKACDVAACPSQGILTSSSVALAMSAGLPVIAPAEGCIPEEVGSAGFLYSNTDSLGLQDKLSEAVASGNDLAGLGLAARVRSAEASPVAIGGQITSAYKSILPSRA